MLHYRKLCYKKAKKKLKICKLRLDKFTKLW